MNDERVDDLAGRAALSTSRRQLLIATIGGASAGALALHSSDASKTQGNDLSLHWQSSLDDSWVDINVVVDGMVYAWISNPDVFEETLHAVDGSTGSEVRQHTAVGDTRLVIVGSGTVSVQTNDFESDPPYSVYGLDVATGQPRWSWLDQGFPPASVLETDKDTIYLRTIGQVTPELVMAMDTARRGIVWTAEISQPLNAVSDSNRTYIWSYSGDSLLVSLDNETGEQVWLLPSALGLRCSLRVYLSEPSYSWHNDWTAMKTTRSSASSGNGCRALALQL
ncbi:MAG: hypothetical protein M3457_02285 [Chloroflexota bacterium]|nr:hypothetical protein [Chloroflexota bacterium]